MRILNLGQYQLSPERAEREIPFKTSIFPGGEIFFRLAEERVVLDSGFLTGGDVVHILTRLNDSASVMQLVMAVDALRRAGWSSLLCSIPYIPYAQQDRVCNPGESLSIKVFADIINGLNFERVHVYDPHSDVSIGMLDNVVAHDNRGLVFEAIKNFAQVNIIVPDAGAQKKIYNVIPKDCNSDNLNLVLCSKTRDLETTKLTKVSVPMIENDWPCVIVDDLCLGGATFINIAHRMREMYVEGPIHLCVSHGVFNNGLDQLKQWFAGIITTTSIRETDNDPFVTRIPVYQV